MKKIYIKYFIGAVVIQFFLLNNGYSDVLNHFNGDHSFLINGLKRTYVGYIPPRNGARLPLVIVLHGANSSGAVMRKLTAFKEFARKDRFVVLYPDAVGKYWNDGRNDQHSLTHKTKIDDVAFISRLIKHAIRAYNVDRKRVYIAGMSNGAMLCHRIAMEIPGSIAAMAAVAGTIPKDLADLSPQKPVPVLIIHGTKDSIIPFKGGIIQRGRKKRGEVLSVKETARFWVMKNGCSKKYNFVKIPNRVIIDETIAFKFIYDENITGSEVILVVVEGGGHTWPGMRDILPESIVGKTSQDFDATEMIWNFFKRHKRK